MTISKPFFTHLLLSISATLELHPDFLSDPISYSAKKGVSLIDTPTKDCTFANDPESGERNSRTKSNFHLVSLSAIRLLVSCNETTHTTEIKSIEFQPLLLRKIPSINPVTSEDFSNAFDRLREEVGPLLANPSDCKYLIPDDQSLESPRTHWRRIECSSTLAEVEMAGFHNLSHPETGTAKGITPKRIQLEDSKVGLTILFDKLKPYKTSRSVCVTLSMKGAYLASRFASFGHTKLVNATTRLVGIDLAQCMEVYSLEMSRLIGIYLPFPTERTRGRPVTTARIIALMAYVTPISIAELRAMDKVIRKPSKYTVKKLDQDLTDELAALAPIPVASLLNASVPSPAKASGKSIGHVDTAQAG